MFASHYQIGAATAADMYAILSPIPALTVDNTALATATWALLTLLAVLHEAIAGRGFTTRANSSDKKE